MTRPITLEKNARLALSFLSNSFWSRTRLSGGVGPDLEGVLWGQGGEGTSLMISFSGSSSLGDRSCLDPCDGLEMELEESIEQLNLPLSPHEVRVVVDVAE